jgi:hypothetical protein
MNDKYVDFRLCEWGSWRVKFLEDGMGYPKASASFKEYIPKSTSGGNENFAHNAEEIDSLVNCMSRKYPDCASALKIRYTSSNEGSEIKEKGFSQSNYKNNLRLAKVWLSARIDCNLC